MANIIRATTPTFMYTFSHINVADIVSAYMTIQMNGETVIEKDLSAAVVGEKTLSWTLTQEETLSLSAKTVKHQCNWLTSAGLRGASDEETVYIGRNQKNEVIS